MKLVAIPDDRCPYVHGDRRCERAPGHTGAHFFYTEPDPRPRPQLRSLDADEAGSIGGVNTSLSDLARRVPYGAFGPIREVPVSVTTITMPRRTRDGSVTDEQATEVFEAFAAGRIPKGEAAVVCDNMEKENTARNRARTLAERVKDLHGEKDAYKPLRAHAITDPNNDGRFIGAVSLAPEKKKKDDAPAKDAPKPAPSKPAKSAAS